MKINKVIVHCADTYEDMDIGVEEIRAWHVHGNGWADIGYHYVIRRDGTLENGRSTLIPGAHARGHNEGSLGVCLVGGKGQDDSADANFTIQQYKSLIELVEKIREEHGMVPVLGHRDVSSKACPSFNVQALLGE